MYAYNIWEWIGFFIVYCFIGWVWESLYVSWEYRKWTNRGFLNGPFLPIYGFGAIVMLFCTLPVRDNIFLSFLLGMLGASALEYITGYAMEKLFHVRYWDYSYEILNLNGYICLGCSLVWGLASIFLIKVLHKPVENIITQINSSFLVAVDIVFVVCFVWDIIVSAREAFDLKKIIDEQILQNEKIQRLEKRLDVIIAVAEDDRERMQEKFEDNKEKMQERLEDSRERMQERLEDSRERMQERREDNREKRADTREKIMAELAETRAEFEAKNALYRKRAIRILKRNPGTISRKHKLDKDALRSLFK
jgi:uncharacterized membrane protein